MGDFSNMASRLREILLERIDSGKLQLPTLTKVANEVQQLLDEPNLDMNRISAILDRDPVLAAQALKVSNSALHRRSAQIETIPKAITHLGNRALKQALLSASARHVFVANERRINHAVAGLWEHSVAVAFLSRNVAGIAGCGDGDAAFLAGLLHDIGKIVVAIYLLEFERSLPTREAMDWIDADSWLGLVQELHQDVGTAVAKSWNLPMVINRIILESSDYDAANRLSVGNAVIFANALAKREGIYVGQVDHEAVGSLLMIGKSLLNLDDQVIDGLCRELGDQNFRPAA